MRRFVLLSTIVLLANGCGASALTGFTDTNFDENGFMTATVDGQPWAANHIAVAYLITGFVVTGTQNSGPILLAVGGDISTPGTYSLAPGNPSKASGLVGRLNIGGGSWKSDSTGGAGTLVITTVTAHHVVGTFAFDAVPAKTGATGTEHVTNGKFDVTY